MNDVFKALSDSTRRKILELLSEKDMNAGEIADYFNISKPSISHHLAILKNADLISDERKGQNIVYTLNTTVFQDVVRWFFDITKNEEQKEMQGNKKKDGQGENWDE
ncbi:autorepressor SdpR family transcription factor [Anaerocolumna jejuensis]|uniref:autorepressor SdpR family transcription factor n=1 Tax=Anaerocolumna jejuensis TaxID=259063 RepID=UPI003F7BC225